MKKNVYKVFCFEGTLPLVEEALSWQHDVYTIIKLTNKKIRWLIRWKKRNIRTLSIQKLNDNLFKKERRN
jgi:hypothetical protein